VLYLRTSTVYGDFREVRHWKELTRSNLCLMANPVNNSFQEQVASMDWNMQVIAIGGDLGWLGEGTASALGGGFY